MTRTPDPRITKACPRGAENLGFGPFSYQICSGFDLDPYPPQIDRSAFLGIFLLKALWPNRKRKFDLRRTCKTTFERQKLPGSKRPICRCSIDHRSIPIAAIGDPAKQVDMKRFSDALFSVHHVTIFFVVVWIGTAIMAGEALGFWQPDYRRLLLVTILAYWAGVICDLGLFGRRRNGR